MHSFKTEQKDHSINNLVLILEKIETDFELASKSAVEVINDDSYTGPSEPDNVFDDYMFSTSADDRWFILCSRPRGSVTLIPTLLSLAAYCCAILGNNLCSLFFRPVVDGSTYNNWTNGTVADVRGMTLGLYAYGIEYYDREVEGYILQCSPALPEDIENDVYIRLARAFAALSLLVGLPVICLLSLANCMVLSQKFFRRMAVMLFVVAFFQSMLFIFLQSEKCYLSPDPELSRIKVALMPCELDNGSMISSKCLLIMFVMLKCPRAYLTFT